MKAWNDGFRFLLELAVLASLAAWGWHVGDGSGRWLLTLAAPVGVAAVWTTWVTTNSSSVLRDPWRLLLEIMIFGAAALALASTGRSTWAAAFAVLAAVHLGLTFVLRQRVGAPRVSHSVAVQSNPSEG